MDNEEKREVSFKEKMQMVESAIESFSERFESNFERAEQV